MKKNNLSLWVVGIGLFGLLALSAGAQAHSTGKEIRLDKVGTTSGCNKLTGTAKTGDRANCIKCLKRQAPHHYHTENPEGKRCRPDDGRP